MREKGVPQLVRKVMERLEGGDRMYLCFDVDSMAPAIVSEGTGTPVAGGLTDTKAGQLISSLIQQGKVCCWEIERENPMAQSAFGILGTAANKLSAH